MIIFRSVATTASSTTNPLSVSAPAGVASGDILLLSIALNTTGSTVTAVPSGFTLVDEIAAGAVHIHVYKKTATGAEPATYDVTHSATSTPRMALGVVCWRTDAGKTLAVDSHNVQNNTTASTNRVWPSITTVHTATALNCFAVKDGGSGDSPDAAMAERWDFDVQVPHYLMTQSLSSAGATGTRTSTGSSARSWCVSVAIAELDPPTGPSALAASPISTTRIDLAWVDNSSNELNFELEHCTDNVSWALLTSPAANATTYSHTGLSEHTIHYYRIRAVNADGNSDYSSTASTYTLIAPPTGLTATAAGSTAINLAWTDASGAESGYQVERSNNGTTGWTLINTTAANANSYSDTGLPDNTTRYYRIRGYAGSEFSTYTSVANATTDDALAAPTGLNVTVTSLHRLQLDWTGTNTDETGTEIYRSLNAVTGFALVGTVAAGVVTYSDGGLVANTTYYYKIRDKKTT